jgi:hypothetical protein
MIQTITAGIGRVTILLLVASAFAAHDLRDSRTTNGQDSNVWVLGFTGEDGTDFSCRAFGQGRRM